MRSRIGVVLLGVGWDEIRSPCKAGKTSERVESFKIRPFDGGGVAGKSKILGTPPLYPRFPHRLKQRFSFLFFAFRRFFFVLFCPFHLVLLRL